MIDKSTILNLLNKFSNDHKNITWRLNAIYSSGMNSNLNQIKIYSLPSKNTIGIINYSVETGEVLLCIYQGLKKRKSYHIIDMLLDMINYSKKNTII